MIIEYCDKCTIRIQGPAVEDPATNTRYCAKCAAEMPQLGKSDAAKNLQPTQLSASPAPEVKPLRRDTGGVRIPEPAGSPPPRPKPKPKSESKSESKDSGQIKIIGAALAAVILLIVFVLSRDSNSPTAPEPAKTTATSPLPEATPKIADTPTPAPAKPGPSQAELSLRDRNEQLAREMYNQIKAQLAANPAEKNQVLAKLSELSEKYDGTIAAEDAETLAASLKRGDSTATTTAQQPSPPLKPDPGNWVELTTKSGQFGKSGYIRWHASPAVFGGTLLVKNNGPQNETTRKVYLRFDLSSVDFTVTEACLKLIVETAAEKDQKLVLYGITDESLDDTPFTKDTNWGNAPANNPHSPFEPDKKKATALVTVTMKKSTSPAGSGLDFRGHALMDFINKKKNKKATFILGRETKDGSNLVFLGDSSETPPMLRLKK